MTTVHSLLHPANATMQQLLAHQAFCATQLAMTDCDIDLDSKYEIALELHALEVKFANACVKARQ